MQSNIRIVSRLSILAAAALVAACGGGGGDSPKADTPNTPAAPTVPDNTPKLSGKAIDGYLVGATVCIDTNHNNACDAGEPSTTTDAQGNYSLPDDGAQVGQTLLVQVTPSTRDLSRPEGYTFPAAFTLSQIVTATGQQHITPLSTLVTAQMQTGLSQAQATAAVQALLGNVDPNADYVATNDTDSLAKAIAIVDKLNSFATNGTVSADTVRNTLNAIVAKGDIASVTIADVEAQASQPVYAGANAAEILANPTYGLNGVLTNWGNWNQAPVHALVQDVRQVQNGQLGTTQYEYVAGNWQTAGSKYETMAGAYVMKADTSWSDFVPVAQYRAPLSVSVNGARLTGVDAVTGISYNYEYRLVDLSGRPLADAVTPYFGNIELWNNTAMKTQTFAAGTQSVVGLLSYNTDQVILPVWTVPCADSTVANGFTCDGYLPAVTEDGVTSILTGDANVQYSNIQQAIGLELIGRAGGFSMSLTPAGKIQFVTGGSAGTIVHDGGTWSLYGRSSNVIVMELNAAALETIGRDPILAPVSAGAKLAVGLRNGRLRLGWYYPATYAQKTYQFRNNLPAELVSTSLAAMVR